MTNNSFFIKIRQLFAKFTPAHLAIILIIGAVFIVSSPLLANAQDPQTQTTGISSSGFVPNLTQTLTESIIGVNCNVQENQPALKVYLASSDACYYQGGQGVAYNGLQGGAMQALFQINDKMYQSPPSSAVVWAYDQYQQLHDKQLITTVYAQDPNQVDFYFPGLGYNLLSPVLALWQWSRNMVYTVYIIIIIVISFLILFRQSLGGSTVVTIVNSLPSLIISLVLVTVSYPLAGLFVDGIYVGTNLIQNTLITGTSAPGRELKQSELIPLKDADGNRPVGIYDSYLIQPDDPQMSIWAIWGTSGADVVKCETVLDKDNNPVPVDPNDPDGPKQESCENKIVPNIGDSSVLKYVGTVAQSAIGPGANLIGNSILLTGGNHLIGFVLALAAFMSAIKLFFALLKSYLTLTLAPIYLPWMFLWTAFPSKTKSGIVSALKPLGAATLTFIAIYAVFLLMIIFGQSGNFTGPFRNLGQFQFVPPLLGYGSEFQSDSSIVKSILIYMLFMMTPTIPDMVNNLLNVQSGGQTLQRIGQSTAKAGGQAAGMFRGVTNLAGLTGKKS